MYICVHVGITVLQWLMLTEWGHKLTLNFISHKTSQLLLVVVPKTVLDQNFYSQNCINRYFIFTLKLEMCICFNAQNCWELKHSGKHNN